MPESVGEKQLIYPVYFEGTLRQLDGESLDRVRREWDNRGPCKQLPFRVWRKQTTLPDVWRYRRTHTRAFDWPDEVLALVWEHVRVDLHARLKRRLWYHVHEAIRFLNGEMIWRRVMYEWYSCTASGRDKYYID
jgi:hypothetical protein